MNKQESLSRMPGFYPQQDIYWAWRCTCDPSASEVETGGPEVQGHPKLQGELGMLLLQSVNSK